MDLGSRRRGQCTSEAGPLQCQVMEFGGVHDDLYVVEDSDLEYSDCSDEGSSDDEDCSHQYHSRKSAGQQDLSSEDEFEKEMASEVLSIMKKMAVPALSNKAKGLAGSSGPSKSLPTVSGSSQGPSSQGSSNTAKFYDEVYFDSSESSDEGEKEEGGATEERSTGRVGPRKGRKSGSSKKVKKLTNDELFYDPDLDDQNEKWMNRQRMAYHNVEVSRQLLEQKKKEDKVADQKAGDPSANEGVGGVSVRKSDAVLNCPGCMGTLCLDCQRHDIYANQYRAVFVLNCQVMRDEVLKYVPKPSKKSRKRSRSRGPRDSGQLQEGNSESQEADSYHPVRCTGCNTEVAVMDSEEIFHFFNVLPSAPS